MTMDGVKPLVCNGGSGSDETIFSHDPCRLQKNPIQNPNAAHYFSIVRRQSACWPARGAERMMDQNGTTNEES